MTPNKSLGLGTASLAQVRLSIGKFGLWLSTMYFGKGHSGKGMHQGPHASQERQAPLSMLPQCTQLRESAGEESGLN